MHTYMYIHVCSSVALPFMLVGGQGRYKLVSELVELSEVSELWRFPTCWWLGTLKIGIRAKVSTLIVDGPC
jgi:hypothetical protein